MLVSEYCRGVDRKKVSVCVWIQCKYWLHYRRPNCCLGADRGPEIILTLELTEVLTRRWLRLNVAAAGT